jgi:ribonuclease III family protein
MEASQYNGLTLAYIGDAIYELRVRSYLLTCGLTKVNELHKKAINYTAGAKQSYAMHYFIDNNLLSEEEISYFKRGRNSSVAHIRKNITRSDYLEGTGFESLIGYLYLSNQIDRMDEIINKTIEVINNKKED